jgi:hypothetical protein
MQDMPRIMDVEVGSERVIQYAHICVMVGKYDEAVDQLDDYLEHPGYGGIAGLLINPHFAPLHDFPRFQELVRKYSQ